MENDLAVSDKSGRSRIVAFDILRGLFLIIIMINHVELYPSILDFFTGRGRLLVSAAEGFFFMSGLLVGLVYRRKLYHGMRFIFKKMWTRAAELYLASVVLTLLFAFTAYSLHHPSIKDGLSDVVDWQHLISQTLLMRYGFGWADFLDRFAILMFMAPFGFYLLSKKKWWLLLAISLLAWSFRGNNFTLSWQVIFSLGMIIGYHWHETTSRYAKFQPQTKRRLKIAVIATTAVTFVLSYASVYLLSVLNQNWDKLSASWQSFTFHWNSVNSYVWLYAEKWNMGPLRIVLFLTWFTALFMLVNKYASQINKYTYGVVDLMGRNSLFVYVAHAFIVFIFKFFIPPTTTLLQNFSITTAALIVLVAVTVVYSKMSLARKTPPRHRINPRPKQGKHHLESRPVEN